MSAIEIFILCLYAVAAILAAFLTHQVLKRNIHRWLGSYILSKIKRKPGRPMNQPIHIMFAIVDHFEPLYGNPPIEQELKRLYAWINNYPLTVQKHSDADGIPPQHTFFYPYDEYRAVHLDELAKLCSMRYGEIELHLHHDGDTAEKLYNKLQDAKEIFARHGALITSDDDQVSAYGFIHGNWSLDNSRKDGRWCGVNDELQILSETGCYADFTMPSAPSETQTKKINSIYYATDDPKKSKSHNTGIDVKVNGIPLGDLMMIQGPLCLNWRRRKAFIIPAIENGEVAYHNPPAPDRADLWIKQNIHVQERPEWVFVKVYTHGAQDGNCESLIGRNGHLDKLYSYLESAYNDGTKYKLHYVTAREMYNIIKAAESGEVGNPNSYRDYIIKPYANKTAEILN